MHNGKWIQRTASVPVFLAGILLGLAPTHVVFAQSLPPIRPDGLTYQDLIERLEATEAELSYLRARDQERAEWESQVVKRLPAVSSVYLAAEERPKSASPEGKGQLSCEGIGTLCQSCKEKLSWNKGPWRIVPFGVLSGEAIGATSNTRARPFVLYVEPGSPADNEQFTIHGQTSSLGFNFSGPRIGCFDLGGMVLFNFLGDRPALNQATPFFLRGYGELKNEDWRFTFGQQGDLFNPIGPDTVNFGGNKQAGNGGSFRGSLRAERYFRPSDTVQWTIQSAISQQVVTDFVVDPRIVGSDNGWPNVEGRIGLGLGRLTGGSRPVELGVSGVIGQTRAFGVLDILLPNLGDGIYTTWGLSTDAQFRAERWGTNVELFMGQAIGTYNCGIGQSLDPTGFRAIRAVGGWGDVWYKLTDRLTTHVGYGIDDPLDQDVGQFLDDALNPTAGQRTRNEVYWANLIWDVTAQFDVGFEVSYRETGYLAPSVSNSAMIYHFRTRVKF